MISFDILVSASLVYVIILFAVAYWAEGLARAGRSNWLRSPWIYTLSLSIYCTAWTFYGAVGYAASSGLEFLTIYIGPTLVLVGWWWILRKLVQIGRSQRITSIADLVSSRYGKSPLMASLVTLLAVVGTTPYIALQLQSVTVSYAVFAVGQSGIFPIADQRATAIWVAIGLAVFTILFGTRNLDANERHHGVVIAIAIEALVKLAALLAVGIFVVWGVAGGIEAAVEQINASPLADVPIEESRWLTMIFVSGAAFFCLPRMFQVLVVENEHERSLHTASWAFPIYLALISIFVIPIAAVGLAVLPGDANPDLFVLTLPLYFGQDLLALLAFMGGFSAATSMVIVAAIALATMVSNHVVMPLWLQLLEATGRNPSNVRLVLLAARRISIVLVLGLGYLYYSFSGGGTALAAIGLVSFVGVAQVLPSVIGGIFWRGATHRGAAWGLSVGFVVWIYTLFLPSIGPGTFFSAEMLNHGPLGLTWLRPHALFGLEGLDPVVHAVMWSMGFNIGAFILGSLTSFPGPLERLQGAQFVDVFDYSANPSGRRYSTAEAEDLLAMLQRILGPDAAQDIFQREAQAQGTGGYLPEITVDFLDRLERRLAGAVGAATAHAMVGQVVSGATVSVDDLLAVADETAQIMEQTSQIQAKSEELTRTARQLRHANAKLTELSVQKDAFLAQISHELRTPMTSIRALSEILMNDRSLSEEERAHFSGVIHAEALRLTRLLDDLLDLNVLEHGRVQLTLEDIRLSELLTRALTATSSVQGHAPLQVKRSLLDEAIILRTDADRLSQVFINIVANARKYCDGDPPQLHIHIRRRGPLVDVDFVDNGTGIPTDKQTVIFEKFSRLSDQAKAGGAGLGLAISKEIMTKLGGSLSYLPGQGGAAFRVTFPTVSNRTLA
ncbi:MAG: ATP-binding protein [Mangrovicoccus sp.]